MITKICEKVYLGSLKDAEALLASNALSIVSVLTLCPEAVSHRASGVEYVCAPFADCRPISAQEFDAVMAAITRGVRRGNLLIHCVGGMSRSPIMAAAWMHRCGYLNFDEALLAIERLRPIIDPSPVLLRSVGEHLCR